MGGEKCTHTHTFPCHTNQSIGQWFFSKKPIAENKRSVFLLNKMLHLFQRLLCLQTEGSVSSVQSLSCVRLFATPWIAVHQASLSITNPRVYSNSCPLSQWCHPTISSSIVPFPSRLQSFPGSFLFRVFSKESVLHIRWPKDWSFSFSISLSNEYSGLVSFRIDWLDLPVVQGTLKSLLQHHSSKASTLRRSAFFMVQLSHPYTTTG